MKKILSACLSLFLALSFTLQAQSPKYIFYFIGDGMGPGAVMGADTYLRLVRKQKEPLLMMQFPVASLVTTYSASSPVTDSAAAGTALSTGHKTRNNMFGMDADTVSVRNVAEDLADLGYGISLITNVCPDDATPAAFCAHVPARTDWYDIAVQASQFPALKFLAGSMLRGAKRGGRYTGLYERIAENGMTLVRGAENLPGVNAERIILLNTDTISQNIGYTIDGPTGNTLDQYFDAALAHMQRVSPDRFFMMVEGGNIDWAAHDDDAATVIREVLAYDRVLRKAYDFYLAHPDETLIIVTADHETGGMSVGQRSVGYNNYPHYVDRQNKSKALFSEESWKIINSPDSITWEDMTAKLRRHLGFFSPTELNADQLRRLQDSFRRTFIEKRGESTSGLYSKHPEFVEVAYTIQNELAGYGFTTPNHSGNPVPLYSIGVGSELFSRPLDNTQIPQIIRSLTSNPQKK